MKKLAIVGASAALAAMPVVGVFATQDTPTQHTDNININVPQVCTLGTVYQGVADDIDAEATTTPTATPAKKVNDVSHETVTASNGWTLRGNISNPSTAPSPLYDTLNYTIYAGTEVASMGTTTFTIRCNDDKGYDFKAVGSTRNNGSADVATLTKPADSGLDNAAYIDTGTGASFNPASTASYWNFKFASSDAGISIAGATSGQQGWSGGYADASVIPATATTVASGVDGNLTTGQSLTVTYGAGINNAQAAGTYNGTVTYTLAPKTTN